jgi:glycine cleavage system aminomethyltransferase T
MQTTATRNKAGFFKLATFCSLSITWKDGKRAFDTAAEAIASAKKPGKYRVSHVTDSGRRDGEPFSV